MTRRWLSLVFVLLTSYTLLDALLYPRESESREVKDLSGRWKFAVDSSPERDVGFRERWWEGRLVDVTDDVIDMPVPASWNDVTADRKLRDFVGWAWYETEFRVPASWKNDLTRVWLRIGSAHYYAIVWLNGVQMMEHEGGHLPFECDVTSHVTGAGVNRLTIAVNNTLTPHTLPPGTIQYKKPSDGYPPGYFTQEYQFDFFNYAGIHRPVKLYTAPAVRIDHISTTAVHISDRAATIGYRVNTTRAANVTVELHDKKGNVVAKSNALSGQLVVPDPILWWPVGMNVTVGYLYTLVAHASTDRTTDVYRLPIGVRSVSWDGGRFKINGRPFFFLGVGKHEDWEVRGKGFDWASVVQDFDRLRWLGANSFRTSHYPYAEEIMQMCDERGIAVVDEAPAVGMASRDNFVSATLQHHLAVMRELVARDENHPSVVMWSIANEPASSLTQARDYFRVVLNYTRGLDPSRPLTFACNHGVGSDLVTPYVDVVSLNKYEAWYDDPGRVDVVESRLGLYLDQWKAARTQPLLITEWGAGAVAGFHSLPAQMYTEDYHCDVILRHFRVFEQQRADGRLTGAMIWNFADFATAQGSKRAYGNRKGVFTRQRHPKAAAHVVRGVYRKWMNQTASSEDVMTSSDETERRAVFNMR